MANLQLGFYKAYNGNWDDKIIDRFSGKLGYSHCEIVVDEYHMIGAHFRTKSVQEFRYPYIYNHPMWDIYEIDIDATEAIKWAKSKIGTPYDTLGVVLYFMGLKWLDDKDAMWCSEFVANAYNIAMQDIFHTEPLVMPNDLYKDLHSKLTLVSNLKANRYKEILPYNLDKYGRIIDE